MDIRIGKISKIVLQTIAVVGVISVAMLAPNALQMFGILPEFKKKRFEKEDYIRNKVIQKLKKDGLICFEDKNGYKHVQLTEKGKKLVENIKQNDIKITKPKKWDKKWRVIIFDIKESRRKARDQFRLQLRNLGFKQLQRSVWVYPYPCDSVIKLFKADLLIGKDILYMKVDSIENDRWLKKDFGLL